MMSLRRYIDKPMPIMAYTTRRHLLLDIDNATLWKVIGIVKMIMLQWHKVGDCLILHSSSGLDNIELRYTKYGRVLLKRVRDNYHLVFDNGIGYNLCCKIAEVLAELRILEKDYAKIRKFRGDMSLRLSPAILRDYIKPIPAPITRIKNVHTDRKDGYINKYLDVLRIVISMFPFFFSRNRF